MKYTVIINYQIIKINYNNVKNELYTIKVYVK